MSVPIRVRMTAWYVALLAVIIAGVGAFLVLSLRTDLTDAIDGVLVPGSERIAHGYRVEGPTEFVDTADSVLTGERSAAQALDSDGRVVLSAGDPVARTPLLPADARAAVLRGAVVKRTVRPTGGGGQFRLVARAVDRGGRREIVVATASLAPVARSVHRLLILLLLACPAALVATAGGGWLLARRALRPIDRLTTTAAGIGVERLGERLAVPRTSDEVAKLAGTLNTMLERIEQGVAEQRRLVADASHELRTPLAAMRSELDVSLRLDDLSPAARDVLESAREEVDRMSAIVADLLTLGRMDEGQLAFASRRVDLRDLADVVAETLRPLASRHGVAIDVLGETTPAQLDPERIRHVLRNLVANAIEFSPSGGRVEIIARRSDHEARLEIADQGPGVAPELRERVFDRFFRADPSRARASGGSGLGLAIAREIVLAHGGTIGIEDHEPHGSRFWVAFPQ